MKWVVSFSILGPFGPRRATAMLRAGKQQEMFQREAKFKHQKQNELVALQKRVQTGREEQKKQRQMDLERLLQRYQNVKSELEAQQNLERIRAERMASSGQWNWGSTTTKAGAQVA